MKDVFPQDDGRPVEDFRALEALLDEALAPEAMAGGVPAGLTDRIVAATTPRLRGLRGLRGFRGGVLARIGPRRLGAAVAAAAALAAAVLFAVSGGGFHRVAVPPGPGPRTFVEAMPVPTPAAPRETATAPAAVEPALPDPMALERQVALAASYTGPSAGIDRELDLLALRIEQASAGDWDAADEVFATAGEAETLEDPFNEDSLLF